MKFVLCLILGSIAGVLNAPSPETGGGRILPYDIIVLSTNLQPAQVHRFTNFLRQAWTSTADLGNRIAKLAELAGAEPFPHLNGDVHYSWSVTVNDEALYHNAAYYIKFKVRDVFVAKIVTLFSARSPE